MFSLPIEILALFDRKKDLHLLQGGIFLNDFNKGFLMGTVLGTIITWCIFS